MTTIAVAYSGRFQSTIDTMPDTAVCRQPPTAATVLVVMFVITSTGVEPFRLTLEVFVAEVMGFGPTRSPRIFPSRIQTGCRSAP